jgi:Uncharacterized protein conserved in bacteria
MKAVFGALFITLISLASFAQDLTSPVGQWKTIDDVTGKPRSIVKIEKEGDSYTGVIEKIFPQEGDKENPVCDKCKGDKKDQPIIGMKFMWGLKEKGSEFGGGEILDPKNGTVYRCKMELKSGGKELKVRGFVGVSLFGRTQTWYRAEE